MTRKRTCGTTPEISPSGGDARPGARRFRARGGARLLLALLAAGALLSGCGGGGGTVASTPDPTPAPAPTPPPPPEPCEVETADFGCISDATYRERRDTIARDHRFEDVLFQNQWGLEMVNADKAWADVELLRGTAPPGSGVTIGFIDTGIDPGHPLLQGKTIPETFLRTAAGQAVDEDGLSSFSHGTAVASVAGASPASECRYTFQDTPHCVEFRGVAPGADLRMFAIPLGASPPGIIFHRSEPETLDEGHDAANYARALRPDENLDVLNLSFGVTGLIDAYTEAELRTHYGDAIAVLAQADRARKTILVWAAGNDNLISCLPGAPNCGACVPSLVRSCTAPELDPRDDEFKLPGSLDARSPNVLNGMMARIPELRGHSVAVVAVDDKGVIAGYSNRCGIAANWCLAAPGGGDVGGRMSVAYSGPSDDPNDPDDEPFKDHNIALLSGTSFAAPVVAGGLAVMRHVFRDQLSSEELLTRLFRTANKTDRYADRLIYGQGLMDLGAATNPVGELQVAAGGGSVGDAGHSLSATRLSMGGPLGDGIAIALGGAEIAAMDSLGAPFWFDPSALTLPSGGGLSTERRLHDLIAPRRRKQREAPREAGWSSGFYQSPVASESSLFDLAGNAATFSYRTPGGLEAAAFAASGPAHERNESLDTGGLTLVWRPPDSGLGARLGWLREGDSALGSRADGAFGRLSADSLVAGVEAETSLGGWRLAAEAEAGVSRIHAGGGMITGFSEVTTSALALSARRPLGARDALAFSVSQPSRVESGSARLSLPVGRTWSGTILRRPVSADMAPSGRQIDASARWRRADVWKGDLSVEAIWSRHPGHARKGSELGLLAGWRTRW